MRLQQKLEHQQAVNEWVDISKFNHPHAVTLTLKKSVSGMYLNKPVRVAISKGAASENFRRFLDILNGKVFRKYGKRYNKRIKVFAAMERSKTKHLHYHAAIDCPKEYQGNDFEGLIRECWAKTIWGNEQMCVVSEMNQGWITYITKLRDKYSVTDAVDWINVTL